MRALTPADRNPLARRAILRIVALYNQLGQETFFVPPSGGARGQKRKDKWAPKPWADALPALRSFRTILRAQLESRFLRDIPDSNILLCLGLNLWLSKKTLATICNGRWLEAIRRALDAEGAVVERHLAALWSQSTRDSASARAPETSPARRSQAKQPRAAQGVMTDALDAFMRDDDDDEELPPGLGTGMYNYRQEMEGMSAITRAELDQTFRPNDVLGFYASAKERYPVLHHMAVKAYGSLASEANVERIFRYSGECRAVSSMRKRPPRFTFAPCPPSLALLAGLLLSKLRTSMSTDVARAFCLVAHNLPYFERVHGKLDYQRIFEIYAEQKVEGLSTSVDSETESEEGMEDEPEEE